MEFDLPRALFKLDLGLIFRWSLNKTSPMGEILEKITGEGVLRSRSQNRPIFSGSDYKNNEIFLKSISLSSLYYCLKLCRVVLWDIKGRFDTFLIVKQLNIHYYFNVAYVMISLSCCYGKLSFILCRRYVI